MKKILKKNTIIITILIIILITLTAFGELKSNAKNEILSKNVKKYNEEQEKIKKQKVIDEINSAKVSTLYFINGQEIKYFLEYTISNINLNNYDISIDENPYFEYNSNDKTIVYNGSNIEDNYELNLNLTNNQTNVSSKLKIDTSIINISNDISGIENKNILFIGDSYIASGKITETFLSILNQNGINNIKLLGKKSKSESNRYEAQGGFGWENYITQGNELKEPYNHNYMWNSNTNSVDILNYLNGEALDYLVINLGINQFANAESGYSSDINNITSYCKEFLTYIHNVYPNCKIILNGIHNSFNWNTGDSKAKEINNLYKEISNSEEYSSYVKYANIVSIYDFNEFWGGNEKDYVHPNDLGYSQIGKLDLAIVLSWMKDNI